MRDNVNTILDEIPFLRNSRIGKRISPKDDSMAKRSDSDTADAEIKKDTLMFSEEVQAPIPEALPWYKNKGTLGMAGLSLVWLGATAHYLISSGWWALRYEMTPPEFFSFTVE